MLETLLFIVVFTLSVIGLSDLIHWVWIRIIKPKGRLKKTLLCYISGDFADLQLKIAFEELLWYGKSYADELIAVYCNIEESVFSRCLEYSKQNNIRLISNDEAYKINVTEL